MASEPSVEPILRLEQAPPEAEVVFLSTDSAGTPGQLNESVLGQLGLDRRSLPRSSDLHLGYALLDGPKGLLCFVVTIDGRSTAEALQANLRAALFDERILGARSLWIPLMGTGAGRLSFEDSEQIIIGELKNAEWRERANARNIIVSFPRGVLTYRQLTESAHAALGVASSLAPLVNNDVLSTSLLFFALALANDPAAPPALTADSDAACFAIAVGTAPHGLAPAWSAYFPPGTPRPSIIEPKALLPPTDNIVEVMARARQRAADEKRSLVGIDDLSEALLALGAGRFRRAMESTGFGPRELLAAYQNMRVGRVVMSLMRDVPGIEDRLGYEAYAEAIASFLLDSRTPPPLSVSIQAPWGAGKSTLMQLIREKIDPKEQRDKDARRSEHSLTLGRVISFLEHREELPAGKLGESRRWTVWFNAWKYETAPQVWAGLVDAIVDQVSRRLPPAERELFLLRLHLARIDDGKVRERIYNRVTAFWWKKGRRAIETVIAGGAGAGGVAVAPKVVPALVSQAGALSSGVGAAVVMTIYLLGTYFWSLMKTKSEPADFSLSDYIKVPDYDLTVGAVHRIHADLLKVLEVTPRVGEGHSPIVIFIDDLDRCSPSSVAQVVEGVSMFLASDLYRCMFIIGMDPQMVAAALETAHSDVRRRLPPWERAVPLGWRFMDKFVQLPFTIPPSTRLDLERYLGHISGIGPKGREPGGDVAAVAESEVDHREAGTKAVLMRALERLLDAGRQLGDKLTKAAASARSRLAANAQTPPSMAEPLAEDVAPATDSAVETDVVPDSHEEPAAPTRNDVENPGVGHIVRRAAEFMSGNPRELKRLANLARLYLELRDSRRRAEREHIPKSSPQEEWQPPSLDQYARWLALTLRWPDMMRWLQWGCDEAGWDSTNVDAQLVVRRLAIFEDQASKSREGGGDEWRGQVAARLKLPPNCEWLRDPNLFEFFRKEARYAAGQRLSAAAAREFW